MTTPCEQDYRRFAEIVNTITYKPGWTVLLRRDADNGRCYVQIHVSTTSDASLDSQKRNGTRTEWKSAKRYLSKHMSRQEVVGSVFGLIKDAELHEVHEWFRYKGASIYNPHLDPDILAEVAGQASSFNVRKNAMAMDEGGDVAGPQPDTNPVSQAMYAYVFGGGRRQSPPSPQSNWR